MLLRASVRLQLGNNAPHAPQLCSRNDAVQQETKLEPQLRAFLFFSFFLLLYSCAAHSCMRMWTGCIVLGRVRVCTSASASPLSAVWQLVQKQNRSTNIFGLTRTRCACLFFFVSYLKGLNVNRLLLAIVLPSAPPIIIFQNQRPMTSLLTSHHGTSGGQTFSPRPIHGAVQLGYLARTCIPQRKRDQLLFRVSSFTSQKTSFSVLFHRQTKTENELKSPRVVSPISL